VGGRDIIVVGASRGGGEPLRQLVGALPADLPAATFVVLHVPSWSSGSTPARLANHSSLPALYPQDGERIAPGHVYIAPPNSHLLLERGRLRLQQSPKEAYVRPAIDVLFRSAAIAYGRRVAGVILSGMGVDGTAGLWEVKKRGGVAIVQDPDEALEPSMPASALRQVPIDYCLPAGQIAPLLTELARREPAPPPLHGPQPGKLLIVEDERIIARNLEQRLRELGYDVTASAGTGEEAIAEAEATRPDLALMDIQLPGPLDGTDAARLLWERCHVPAVYITAHADAETIDRVKGTECYGYIVKPFQPREIHAVIQIALDRLDKDQSGH
jgi:chemotaxis response regulator CheB